jgi:hypothetical protein
VVAGHVFLFSARAARLTRTVITAGILATATVVSSAARADEKAACLGAASKGQTLRDAHQLIEARDQLRTCARQACPSIVAADCATWLDAVEKSLPTLVMTAKNAAGADVIAVKVSVDGHPLLAALDGKAAPMNPGPHTFHFEAEDGWTADQQVLVKEGEHNRSIAVVLGPRAASSAVPAPPPGVPARGSATLRLAGFILGGVGVAGIAVGAVAGGLTLADKSSAHCNAAGLCAAGPLASARTMAKVSDAGFIGGAVLLAGGVVLFVVSRGGGGNVGLSVTPPIGAAAGRLALEGAW